MRTTRMRATCGSWRVWGALAVLLTASGPAHAFYWYDWPGSLAPPQPSLVTPPTFLTPGTTGQPQTPNPPAGPPVPVDKPPIGPPEHTPEPATGVIGLIGLGAIAARKWWKKV